MLARLQKSMKEKDQGFTLIELLVVIIIIGILAAIAIPVFLNQRKKATESSVKSDLRTVANEMETYYTDAGSYPAAGFAATATPSIGTGNVVKISSGNEIAMALTTPTGTYCLTGTNPQVDDPWYYDSDGGGLTKNSCVTAAP
jgi:type IV pilus assembly protein PilA